MTKTVKILNKISQYAAISFWTKKRQIRMRRVNQTHSQLQISLDIEVKAWSWLEFDLLRWFYRVFRIGTQKIMNI